MTERVEGEAERPDATGFDRLSRYLPAFDVESRHAIRIAAPGSTVYAIARRGDVSRSWLARLLFRLRGLPRSALTLQGLERLRFKPLAEEPGRYFMLGLIGRFWTPRGHLIDFDPAAFVDFSDPGFAKAVWWFGVTEDADGTTLRTATRVHCLDAGSRRLFRVYWSAVGPFSGLIREEFLRTVRDQAQTQANR